MAKSNDDLNRQFRSIARALGDLRPVNELSTHTELLEAHEALHGQWLELLGTLDQLRKTEMKLRLDMTDLRTHDDVDRCKKQLTELDETQRSFMQYQADVWTRANDLEHRRWELG
jgi:hypothetical protein